MTPTPLERAQKIVAEFSAAREKIGWTGLTEQIRVAIVEATNDEVEVAPGTSETCDLTPEETGQAIQWKAQEILDIMRRAPRGAEITFCVWCGVSGMTDAECRKHLATCEKHPAVQRLAARERDIEEIRNAVNSAAAAMASTAEDTSINRHLAWVYGILLGWDTALDEIAKDHQWSVGSVQQLQKHHSAIAALKRGSGGEKASI